MTSIERVHVRAAWAYLKETLSKLNHELNEKDLDAIDVINNSLEDLLASDYAFESWND